VSTPVNVKVRIVGEAHQLPPLWPPGWPAPREGETVHLGETTLRVQAVAWYPVGSQGSEPFIYVVLKVIGE
jgi:hypothetical protein